MNTRYCVFHPRNPAAVQCSGCVRALCPACDHRIRGFPYCQDCIVAGVEMLRQKTAQAAVAPAPVNVARRTSSPLAAALLSFIVPGLGAAYNGQTSKAIVHFTVFASFFQMATITDGVPFFALGAFASWLFTVVDAYRTGQLMRAGLAPDAAGDVITRRLYGNPLAWGITLVTLGTIFLLHTLFGLRFPMRELLPVALVGLGLYMLFDYARRRSLKRETGALTFDAHHRPPSVVVATANTAPSATDALEANDFLTQASAREVRSAPFEPRV